MLQEDQYTFLITSRSVLLRMKNVLGGSCRESQNTYFMSKHVFFLKRGLYEIAWKNIVEWGKLHDNIAHAHCILDYKGYKHTLSEYVIYCFPTAKKGYINAPQC